MPAQRPRSTFKPIPPDLDLDQLVESTPSFQYVDRISCDMIDVHDLEKFEKLVHLHVVEGGKPLVIDGYQSRLDPWTFSPKWLQHNHGDKEEFARDLRKEHLTTPLTIGHYLRNMGMLTEQYFDTPNAFQDLTRQRVYLKDIDCPDVWQDKLREHLPPNLFYLNENSGELGGPGSVDEVTAASGRRKGRGIAGAGDLMSALPAPMRAQNLMCYIGHEGTYTPAHREMCASMGHNLMVEASDVVGEDGKPERPGSSIWFMTESKDRKLVAEYWLSALGHDIEVEKHFAQTDILKCAPFTTYIVEQGAGDLILIPPMAPHQVWNRGTRTMKVAWNRTTIDTLHFAFTEALPNARLVCRDEQYKNKAIVYYALQKYSDLLTMVKDQQQTASSAEEAHRLRTSPKIRQLYKDFKRLFGMYKNILLSEMFSPDAPNERNVEYFPFDSNITCAYCRGNIFNRFLTCKSCEHLLGTTGPEPYDVCMDCYTMGRSCACISKLKWAEQFKWKELVQKYESYRRQYLDHDAGSRNAASPLPLLEERERLQKKTLAQICQDQLKRRPWVDVNKPEPEPDEQSDEEVEVNDDGTVKKRKKRSEAWLKNNHTCHVCCHRHEKWKMAACRCGRHWCYGTLYRGYDSLPQDIMADPDWQCPHCKGICFAGACRKDPRQTPYEPTDTLLGHDTRKVADARSVESLVDFGVSNLTFLKETATMPVLESARLRNRHRQAEAERSGIDGDDAVGDEMATSDDVMDHALEADTSMIDPSLITADDSSYTQRNGYHPATSSIYVAPAALMIDPSADGHVEEHSTSYPAIDPPNGKKRKGMSDDTIKRLPAPKSRRIDSEAQEALPNATKQYRKEQERKAFEEARKAGRFIQMQAALRGRTKLVILKLGRATMARVAAPEAAKLTGIDSDLLKSDIAPAQPPGQPVVGPAEKPSKAVRIRVERDDDFGARHRRRQRKSTSLRGSRAHDIYYEELQDVTDEEDGQEDASFHEGALATTETGSKKRRASTWQSKRHGDASSPAILPNDYREKGHPGTRSGNTRASFGPLSQPIASVDVDSDPPSQDEHVRLASAALDLSNECDKRSDAVPRNVRRGATLTVKSGRGNEKKIVGSQRAKGIRSST